VNNIRSKILNGTATREEKDAFYESLQSDSAAKKDFIKHKMLHSVMQASALRTSKSHKEKKFEQFWIKTQKSKRKKVLLQFAKYAAVFAIALVLGRFISDNIGQPASQQIQVVQSQAGSMNTFQFIDGSKVWLNAASEIQILSQSSNEVRLALNGEAYFDILHNEQRSFIVEAGGLQIIDKGTKFNIRSYPDDKKVTTTLIEGDIDVLNKQGQLFANLNPGDHLSYYKDNNQLKIDSIDASVANGWIDGDFVFINQELGSIAKELENWYNVRIIFNDKAVANVRFTGVFNRSSGINQILYMLSFSEGLKYQINESKNGKKEIIIN